MHFCEYPRKPLETGWKDRHRTLWARAGVAHCRTALGMHAQSSLCVVKSVGGEGAPIMALSSVDFHRPRRRWKSGPNFHRWAGSIKNLLTMRSQKNFGAGARS